MGQTASAATNALEFADRTCTDQAWIDSRIDARRGFSASFAWLYYMHLWHMPQTVVKGESGGAVHHHKFHMASDEPIAGLSLGAEFAVHDDDKLLFCRTCPFVLRVRADDVPPACERHFYQFPEGTPVPPFIGAVGATLRCRLGCRVCQHTVSVELTDEPALGQIRALTARVGPDLALATLDHLYRYCAMAPDALAKGKPFGLGNAKYARLIGPSPEAQAILARFGFTHSAAGIAPPAVITDELRARWRETAGPLAWAVLLSAAASAATSGAGSELAVAEAARLAVDARSSVRADDALRGRLGVRPLSARAQAGMEASAELFKDMGLSYDENDEATLVWTVNRHLAEERTHAVVVLTVCLAAQKLGSTLRYTRLLELLASPRVAVARAGAVGLFYFGEDFCSTDEAITTKLYSAVSRAGHLDPLIAHHARAVAELRQSESLSQTIRNLAASDRPLGSPSALSGERNAFRSLLGAAAAKRRPQVTVSPLDAEPYESVPSPTGRRRLVPLPRGVDMPAGLFNLGQSCYLNALLQMLFSVTPLVRAVLEHTAEPAASEPTPMLSVPGEGPASRGAIDRARARGVVTELRKLWAFLAAGNRHAYSAGRVLGQLVASARMGPGHTLVGADTQEDVNEFLYKLLEALRLGLPHDATSTGESNASIDARSVVECLFFGLVHEAPERPDLAPVKFAHVGLDVSRGSVYAALEAAVAPMSDEPHARPSIYVRLPPVLTLLLGRAGFDRLNSTGRKIQERFDCPLELDLTLFATESPDVAPRRAAARADIAQLRASERELQTQLAIASEDEAATLAALATLREARELLRSERVPLAPALAAERWTAADLLDRIVTSTQANSAALVAQLTDVQTAIARLYETPADACDIARHKYVLHAVVVHEGYANSGHYYCFVCDRARARWLCINDAIVTPVSVDEVLARARGGEGTGNESAHSLVYVSAYEPMPPLDADSAVALLLQSNADALVASIQRANEPPVSQDAVDALLG